MKHSEMSVPCGEEERARLHLLERLYPAPRYGVAQMIDASELPFRMLCRKYGATIAWTPMFHRFVPVLALPLAHWCPFRLQTARRLIKPQTKKHPSLHKHHLVRRTLIPH